MRPSGCPDRPHLLGDPPPNQERTQCSPTQTKPWLQGQLEQAASALISMAGCIEKHASQTGTPLLASSETGKWRAREVLRCDSPEALQLLPKSLCQRFSKIQRWLRTPATAHLVRRLAFQQTARKMKASCCTCSARHDPQASQHHHLCYWSMPSQSDCNGTDGRLMTATLTRTHLTMA